MHVVYALYNVETLILQTDSLLLKVQSSSTKIQREKQKTKGNTVRKTATALVFFFRSTYISRSISPYCEVSNPSIVQDAGVRLSDHIHHFRIC